jgi:hypothetical protein
MNNSKICNGCRKIIYPNTLTTMIMDKDYHTACVACNRCDSSLWNKGFTRTNDGKLYCESCDKTNHRDYNNNDSDYNNDNHRPLTNGSQQRMIQSVPVQSQPIPISEPLYNVQRYKAPHNVSTYSY